MNAIVLSSEEITSGTGMSLSFISRSVLGLFSLSSA